MLETSDNGHDGRRSVNGQPMGAARDNETVKPRVGACYASTREEKQVWPTDAAPEIAEKMVVCSAPDGSTVTLLAHWLPANAAAEVP